MGLYFAFRLLAFRDVAVGLKYHQAPIGFLHQSLPAFDLDQPAITRVVLEYTRPRTRTLECILDELDTLGVIGLEQVVTHAIYGLLRCKAVQLFRALIPKRYRSIQCPHQDGVE